MRRAVRAHLVEVVAVNGNRHVAAHAADQFIEAHLDRLGDVVGVAHDGLGDLLDALEHVVLRAHARGPFDSWA